MSQITSYFGGTNPTNDGGWYRREEERMNRLMQTEKYRIVDIDVKPDFEKYPAPRNKVLNLIK